MKQKRAFRDEGGGDDGTKNRQHQQVRTTPVCFTKGLEHEETDKRRCLAVSQLRRILG